ncbi:DUF6033 family protein [Helicobacter sp.]|uniref:DUF6033 family protein n=1 Tax=Helicobacter sp. TaxID=218 RepID=UPI0019AD4714|nr:DUF6033 family protein [Helicobacter sp.]MBD5166013.1 hypothetical protein [Helicobacter sp.]
MSIQSLDGVYVTGAAYDYVKAQNFEQSNANEVLKDLSAKFTNLKINGDNKGLNNLTIAPNILQEMATNKEAREKYEALIYDINELAKNPQTTTMTGGKIAASGFVINADGSLSGWAVSESGDSKEEKTILEKLLESLEEKRKERELEAKRQENKENLTQIKMESSLNIEI